MSNIVYPDPYTQAARELMARAGLVGDAWMFLEVMIRLQLEAGLAVVIRECQSGLPTVGIVDEMPHLVDPE
jgi:hypothetical protein